jgi:hypothetical protein
MSGIQVTTSPTLNWRIAFSPSLTICGTPPSHRCFSLSGDCDEKKKQTSLFHDHQNQGLEMLATLLALRPTSSGTAAGLAGPVARPVDSTRRPS